MATLSGNDLVAVAAMLIALGFTALAFAELSTALRRRITAKAGR